MFFVGDGGIVVAAAVLMVAGLLATVTFLVVFPCRCAHKTTPSKVDHKLKFSPEPSLQEHEKQQWRIPKAWVRGLPTLLAISKLPLTTVLPSRVPV